MKPITAIVVLLLVVASFSVAGCSVTNTGDNSSQNQIQFPTIETSDLSKEITANYASNGYEIVKAFTKATNQYGNVVYTLSLIHISEPTRQAEISYAVFCL